MSSQVLAQELELSDRSLLTQLCAAALISKFEGEGLTWKKARHQIAAYLTVTDGETVGLMAATMPKDDWLEVFEDLERAEVVRIVNRSSGRIQVLRQEGAIVNARSAIVLEVEEVPGDWHHTRADGLCGMHISALAEACGVENPAIRYWLENLADSKWKENRWNLDTEGGLNGNGTPERRGLVGHERGKKPVYVVAGCCWDAIFYYACQGRKSAQAYMRMIGEAGIVAMLHAASGWQPPRSQEDWITKFLEQAITIQPEDMERFFPPHFIEWLERVFGCSRGMGCFPNFYKAFYNRALPAGTWERLDEVNPQITGKGGRKYRSHRIYQHVIQEVRGHLERGIDEYTVAAKATLADGHKGLKALIAKHDQLYGPTLQLGLQYDYGTKRTRITARKPPEEPPIDFNIAS